MVICRHGPPESKTTMRDAPSNNGSANGLAQGSCPAVRPDGNPVKLFVPFTTTEVTSAMSVQMVPVQQGLIEVLATTVPVIGTPFNVPDVGAVSDMNAHTRY